MCSDNAKAFLKALPKCEHHMHIEGSLEPTLLFKLAARNKITLDPTNFPSVEACDERYKNFASLDDFLYFYNEAMASLITEQDFEELVDAYIERSYADGTVHCEIFYDPQAHTGRGIASSTVVNGLNKGLIKAQEKYGITSKLIACFVRHLSVDSVLKTVEDVIQYVERDRYTGWDVIRPRTETRVTEKYALVYQRARDLGVKNLTMHSGEEGPAQYVRTTVEQLGIKRIDHGVRSSDDPEVLKMLAKENAFLTLCPLSNVRLRVMSAVSESPIPKLMEAGVKFSINSDDPAYFGGYLLDNYVAVQDAFNFQKQK
ncbi:adenosine deaminase [Microbotryum lychnidis-dioicae p1A1 Lamole]|uniref:Adenine deaminase n=1 Tax=Microbotryum lychnidis-dioicae (strain p1A1 Lamole / MvSl-1064) TaxID=683840 RepID=U5H2I0_USTV1|nr:adenosine deaminase [Microbotryum lychnidis-dioicae p1A1 Lamole]|eukprot:KDE08303.1 adenosine deaminase [Microbotryum lychnidis-dioicae p1A1 Lamole]